MHRHPPAGEIRKVVARGFQELGATAEEISSMDETLLIDEGRYAASSYAAGDLLAMWLESVGILQFYGREGKMLRTVSLFGETMPRRRAA